MSFFSRYPLKERIFYIRDLQVRFVAPCIKGLVTLHYKNSINKKKNIILKNLLLLEIYFMSEFLV